MGFVGIFGIFLGMLAGTRAFVHPTRLRVAVFTCAFLLHIAASLFYYNLVKEGTTDSALYYYDPMGMFEEGFGLNTAFIVYITQGIKVIAGGSYLDFFLLFQSFGFIGIVYMMRTFEEVYESLGVPQPLYVYALLFMPSIHYWTGALGKDGLFFLATAMTLWGAVQLKRRVVTIALGVALMLAIRPHIAVITLAALALTVVSDKTTGFFARALLFAAAVAGMAFAAYSMWSTFQIDLTKADAVSDHLSGREALLQTEAAGRTSVDAIYPLRVLSLLFRPFFFDVTEILGLIVSFENVLLAACIGMFLVHGRTTRAVIKSVPFARFAFISSTGVLLVLALGYYNVGLGIRQKATMILPGILVLFVAVRSVLDARQQSRSSSWVVMDQPAGHALT